MHNCKTQELLNDGQCPRVKKNACCRENPPQEGVKQSPLPIAPNPEGSQVWDSSHFELLFHLVELLLLLWAPQQKNPLISPSEMRFQLTQLPIA